MRERPQVGRTDFDCYLQDFGVFLHDKTEGGPNKNGKPSNKTITNCFLDTFYFLFRSCIGGWEPPPGKGGNDTGYSRGRRSTAESPHLPRLGPARGGVVAREFAKRGRRPPRGRSRSPSWATLSPEATLQLRARARCSTHTARGTRIGDPSGNKRSRGGTSAPLESLGLGGGAGLRLAFLRTC